MENNELIQSLNWLMALVGFFVGAALVSAIVWVDKSYRRTERRPDSPKPDPGTFLRMRKGEAAGGSR